MTPRASTATIRAAIEAAQASGLAVARVIIDGARIEVVMGSPGDTPADLDPADAWLQAAGARR
jgi:hypothetical protein